MSTTAYFWTHNRLESCEWSPSEMKPNHLASKGEPEGDSTGGPAAASHQRPTAEMCLHPHVTAFKKHECAHTCLLNKSETYQDPSKLLLFHPSGPRRQRSPASLSLTRALSLSLSLCLGWTRLPLAQQSLEFSEVVEVRWSVFTPVASLSPSLSPLLLCCLQV